jgi:hypothetical protein
MIKRKPWPRNNPELRRRTLLRLNEMRCDEIEKLHKDQKPGTSVIRTLAVNAAWTGNMKPLRQFYPDLAPFLQPPRPGRGKWQRHVSLTHAENPKDKRHLAWAIAQAIADVRRIRTIWKTNYGRWKRPDHLAEEIAAKLWDVDVHDVIRALKR